MKRYVRAEAEIAYMKSGFVMETGRFALFYESDAAYLTDKIVRQFIKKVAEIRGASDAIRDAALYNEAALKDFRRRIDKASLTKKQLGNGKNFYTIAGNEFSLNFPEEDFNREVIVF